MGLPQRRQSKTRTSKRRAQQKIAMPGFVSCPQCHEPKQAHRVCPECGYYNNKEVIAVEKEA